MKIKINQLFIRNEIRKMGISFSELEDLTGINKNRWMYILNGNGFVNDTDLELIADVIQCGQNNLIDPDFRSKQNTPLWIEVRMQNLYTRRHGDIQPAYVSMINNFQTVGKLGNIIGEANRLLAILFSDDQLSYNFIPALTVIVNDFKRDRILAGSYAELDDRTIDAIFSIIEDSENHNSTQQALGIFLYALILFDVIFLEESIASITQFEIERFGDKADQYCKLTCSLETLRNTLIRYLVSNNLGMENTLVDEFTDEIMDGVHLMLNACYRAGKHLNGDYVSSEYVNRTELDGIIVDLTRRIRNIGLTVPETFYNLPGSRFGKHLFILRSIFQSGKPKKWSYTPMPFDFFCMGYLSAQNQ